VTTRTTDADRRLALRLAVGLVAVVGLGVPVLLLALLVRSKWDPLLDVDQSVTDALHRLALDHHWLVDAARTISLVLDPWVLRPVVTALGVVLLVRGRRRLGSWVLVALWGGGLLGVLLKVIVGRARPDLVDPVATAAGRSFPSGHALNATVALGLLVLVLGSLLTPGRRRLAWVAAVLGIVLVSASRVLLGVHFLSDVTAGVLVGAAWLGITAAAFTAWHQDVGLDPGAPDEVAPEISEDVPEPR
jgi:membrane-associated phospholipid phosphatase